MKFIKKCMKCNGFMDEKEMVNEVCENCKSGVKNRSIETSNFNDIADELYELNKKWWHDPETGEKLERNKGELIMLMVTELSEAFEGIRRNKMDDHLPHRPMLDVELADLIIRVFVFSSCYDIDLDGAFREKVEYNKTRKDHSTESRLTENGKKF